MRLVAATSVGAGLVMMFAACTDDARPEADPRPSATSASGSTDSTPSGFGRDYQRWLARTPLPSCGEPELPLGGTPYQRSADCLRSAQESGEGAEAVLIYHTVEGDPISTYLRVLPTGAVELFTDETQDNFGSGRWRYGTDCGTWSKNLGLKC